MELGSTFLRRYRLERQPAARLEYVLAVARVFLIVAGFIAIYFDPTEPSRLLSVTYDVLLLYAVYSVTVLLRLRTSHEIGPTFGRVLHGLDILFAAVLTFASNGPGSPFFLFFLFVVLAAAYRWALVETIVTAVMTSVLFLLQTTVAVAGPWGDVLLSGGSFELNRTIMRVAYLLMTGALLGYLAEQEKRFRSEMAATAEAMQLPRVELGLGGSVVALMRMLLGAFGAASADFVLQEHDGRTLLWHVTAADDDSTRASHEPVELDPADQAKWLFPTPAPTWHAAEVVPDQPSRAWTLEPNAWTLGSDIVRLPEGIPAASFQTLMVTSLGLEDEWRGRLYLCDGDSGTLERRLHVLGSLVSQVTPALSNVVLLRRLSSQASAAERAHVARELHDGTIQALIGLEMKVEALRRGADRHAPHVAAELARIQELLRGEVLAVREMMQALRPVELDAVHQLPDVLAEVVERFRHDSGVSARFVTNATAIHLTPAAAIEVVRIVQEGLVNVRKHSRAGNVLVRFMQTTAGYTLAIEDDGRGFDFEGVLTHDELDRARVGPAIIKERARLLGGHVTVESTPRVGARIEVTFGVPVPV